MNIIERMILPIKNVLVVVAQHDRYNHDHMDRYELGMKPINSIWIHYYFLKRHLKTHQINFYPINLNTSDTIPNQKFDTCIFIFNELNGFSKKTVDHWSTVKLLKNRFKCPFILLTEVLTHNSYMNHIHYFDLIFTNRKINFKHVYSLGFAASHERLVPKKDNNKIRILVDHPAYDTGHFNHYDKTKNILEQILNHKFDREVEIRRFISGDVETVKDKNFKVEVYDRKGINILKAFEEYNKADIFFVTHPESMGMSVVECAMAGCLVVTPKGYIKPEFINTVEHVEFTGQIDWDTVLKKMNKNKIRETAKKRSWTVFYNKILILISRKFFNY